MMKNILKNRKGVTLLEGLIALGLLAVVTAGTFGLLLSMARTSQGDLREEMVWAVERANERLQMYVGLSNDDIDDLPEEERFLCSTDTYPHPLAEGTNHNIQCMLPPVCDANNSSFVYSVNDSISLAPTTVLPQNDRVDNMNTVDYTYKKIHFSITCNGFKL